MRILIDECVDWRLSREIFGHEVKTARQMGWSAIRNGELLALAAREFDAFLTVDRNLSFQQNVGSLAIAVIVLRARSNRLADLRLWCLNFFRRSRQCIRVKCMSWLEFDGHGSCQFQRPSKSKPRIAAAARAVLSRHKIRNDLQQGAR